MALIAAYDESDAHFDEEQIEEMFDGYDEEDKPEPGFSETYDEMYWSDFKVNVKEVFAKRKFPVVLRANNSNWRGQTGYARAENVDEVIDKIASFDSSYYQLHKTAGSALHFKLGTHDVPTGFTIDIKPFNQAYWDKVS